MYHALSSLDENLVGGFGIGCILSSGVFGVVSVLNHFYFSEPAFKTDALWIRLSLAALFVYEIFQFSTMGSAIYLHAVSHWAEKDTRQLTRVEWRITTFQIGIIFSSVLTQTFLVIRLYRFTKKMLLSAFIQILIVAHMTFGIIVQVRVLEVEYFEDIVDKDKGIIAAWLAIATLVDTLLAISLSVVFLTRRTGFKATDRILRTMAIYAINTGALTAVCAILCCAVFVSSGFAFVVTTLVVPFGGFYHMTLLANIISRSSISRQLNNSGPMEIDMSVVRRVHGSRSQFTDPVSNSTSFSNLKDGEGDTTVSPGGGGVFRASVSPLRWKRRSRSRSLSRTTPLSPDSPGVTPNMEAFDGKAEEIRGRRGRERRTSWRREKTIPEENIKTATSSQGSTGTHSIVVSVERHVQAESADNTMRSRTGLDLIDESESPTEMRLNGAFPPRVEGSSPLNMPYDTILSRSEPVPHRR